MFEVINKYWGNQKVRFLAVGGFNTGFGLLFFYLTQYLLGKSIGYLGSLYVSFMIVTVISFALYRTMVFRVRGHLFRDFFRFLLVYLVPLGMNTIALPLLVSGFGINIYLAQTLFVVVATAISYIGHKYFSFKRPNKVAVFNNSTN